MSSKKFELEAEIMTQIGNGNYCWFSPFVALCSQDAVKKCTRCPTKVTAETLSAKGSEMLKNTTSEPFFSHSFLLPCHLWTVQDSKQKWKATTSNLHKRPPTTGILWQLLQNLDQTRYSNERTSTSLFSIFILEQGVHLEEQGGDWVGVSPHQGGEGRKGARVQGESVLELLS